MSLAAFRQLLHGAASEDSNTRDAAIANLKELSESHVEDFVCLNIANIADPSYDPTVRVSIVYLQKLVSRGVIFVSPAFFASFWLSLLSALPVCFLRPELTLNLKFTLSTIVAHICSHVYKETGTTEVQSNVCAFFSENADFQPFFLSILADVLLFSGGPGGFDRTLLEHLLSSGPSSPASVAPHFQLVLSAAQL
jgi:hypothetical protein